MKDLAKAGWVDTYKVKVILQRKLTYGVNVIMSSFCKEGEGWKVRYYGKKDIYA